MAAKIARIFGTVGLVCVVASVAVAQSQDEQSASGTAGRMESNVSTAPRDVDPLLGFEIETLRRMLNNAVSRIVELEERVELLEATGDGGGQMVEGQ